MYAPDLARSTIQVRKYRGPDHDGGIAIPVNWPDGRFAEFEVELYGPAVNGPVNPQGRLFMFAGHEYEIHELMDCSSDYAAYKAIPCS